MRREDRKGKARRCRWTFFMLFRPERNSLPVSRKAFVELRGIEPLTS
jgi:hypothetical protein